MDRAQKRDFVSEMAGTLEGAGSIVVAHYAGLSVAEMTTLRGDVRKAGGTVKVAKNKLVKLAIKGSSVEHMAPLFEGQTVLLYAEDPVVAPKAANDFAKANDKLKILGGAMGETSLDVGGVQQLASLPSLDELRAKLVGMIQTPAQRIAVLTAAPASQIARVLGAYARKDEDA